MSEKTLGQVAREAFHSKTMLDSGPEEDWERAAQAVVDELTMRAMANRPEQLPHDAVQAMGDLKSLLKAEGAAAERERCIEEIRKACNGSNVMVPTWEVMKLLRAGGKP